MCNSFSSPLCVVYRTAIAHVPVTHVKHRRSTGDFSFEEMGGIGQRYGLVKKRRNVK